MSIFVKLCGIRDRDALEVAIEAGADAVGIVMADSPRQVDSATAARLVSAAAGRVITVGVFYHPTSAEIEQARDEVGFDWIQAETDSLRDIDRIVSMPVVHDSPELSDAVAKARADSGSGLVLVEGAGKGGRGETPDRTSIKELGHAGDLVIAGGLSPTNVSEVISALHPRGVDVSSGVESAPGEKNFGLMRDFVKRARQSSEEIAK